MTKLILSNSWYLLITQLKQSLTYCALEENVDIQIIFRIIIWSKECDCYALPDKNHHIKSSRDVAKYPLTMVWSTMVSGTPLTGRYDAIFARFSLDFLRCSCCCWSRTWDIWSFNYIGLCRDTHIFFMSKNLLFSKFLWKEQVQVQSAWCVHILCARPQRNLPS